VEYNFVVRPGQLVHLPINKFRAHEPVSDKLTLYEIVFMAKIEGQNLFDYLHLNDGNYVVNISDHEKIMRLFEECAETMTETDFSAYIIRASNISRIISIYVEKRMNKIKDDSPFDALTNYMSNNLKGNVSLEVLSDIVYMQPTYMIKCFKRYFGTSPITYYNKMRADKAADLILNTNMTNEQIGKEIGIEDKYYFSNFFKHHFGVAPSDYRKYLKNIRNMISHYNTAEKPR